MASAMGAGQRHHSCAAYFCETARVSETSVVHTANLGEIACG